MSYRCLVCYMTLGYPNDEEFIEFINKSQKEGCDIYEIGIPTKYAKYDGPIIRRSYKKVFDEKIDFIDLLKKLPNIKKLIALTYLEDQINDFDSFLNIIRDKFNGVLLPDLLIDYLDYLDYYHKKINEFGLKNVIFTTPTFPDKLISKVSEMSGEFLYYGLRPTTGIELPISPDALVSRVRGIVNNKLIVGFGLSLNDIKNVLKAGADGIAIGSAFIQRIETNGIDYAIDLVRELRGILDEFK
ncbi:tryptophan synthase subunit alpha [Caldisphaera sp.]|uniref:tryptophan synthase subunit alpha n=1 Tax=Caldisphaera sp. TaxID=2060322 RepID=UPI0025B7B175|nr:tryptophan synthase subunit alpha [Caldisphaera sp.]